MITPRLALSGVPLAQLRLARALAAKGEQSIERHVPAEAVRPFDEGAVSERHCELLGLAGPNGNAACASV